MAADETVDLRDRAAITGTGQTRFAKVIERSELDLACEAILAACDDAGLPLDEVDGLVRYDVEPVTELDVVYTLGIPHLRFYAETPSGGGGVASIVGIAAMAIATGMARNVVVFRTRKRSRHASFGPRDDASGRPWEQAGGRLGGNAQFHHPFGVASPTQEVAMIARRHMHEFGTRAEHFGMQAVVQRHHATTNPFAQYRDPITLDDWAASRVVADPLRVLDCSLESAGAVALVVSSAAQARDLRQPPAWVLAWAQGEHPGHYGLADYFEHSGSFDGRDTGAVFIGRELFARAGLAPEDVDVAMIFDHYTPVVLMALEQYGFCDMGEGGPFVEAGDTRWPDGRLPVNTNGGSTSESSIHGLNCFPEAVRQLRGTACNQVQDCEVVFVCGAVTDPSGALLLHR